MFSYLWYAISLLVASSLARYVGLQPSRWQCCARPAGDLAVATRLGTMQVKLLRMKRLRDCAQRMWQGFAALQELVKAGSNHFKAIKWN